MWEARTIAEVGGTLNGCVGDDDAVDALDRADCIGDILQPFRVKIWRYFEDKFWTPGRRHCDLVTCLDYTTKKFQ